MFKWFSTFSHSKDYLWHIMREYEFVWVNCCGCRMDVCINKKARINENYSTQINGNKGRGTVERNIGLQIFKILNITSDSKQKNHSKH